MATNQAPAHFYKDWATAENLEMTWVELRDNNMFVGIMFEALLDCRFQVVRPGHHWPGADRWALPPGTYRLVALWVCCRHASELHPIRPAIAVPWKPEREIPPQPPDLMVKEFPQPDHSNGQDHTGQSCRNKGADHFPLAASVPGETADNQGAPDTKGVATAASPPPSPPWLVGISFGKPPASQQPAQQGAAVSKTKPAWAARDMTGPNTPSCRSPSTSTSPPPNLLQQDTAMCWPPAGKQGPALPPAKLPLPSPQRYASSQGASLQKPTALAAAGTPRPRHRPDSQCRFGSRWEIGQRRQIRQPAERPWPEPRACWHQRLQRRRIQQQQERGH